jgi:hypothetical protein
VKSRRLRNVTRRAEAREMCRFHEGVWRACRIAFLEVGGTATPKELYSAIVRRGSFSFGVHDGDAITAIVRTLTSVAGAGMAICGSDSRWTYTPNARHVS